MLNYRNGKKKKKLETYTGVLSVSGLFTLLKILEDPKGVCRLKLNFFNILIY